MASYEARKEEAERDQRFANLKTSRARIQGLVQQWMDEATSLHTASPLTEEQADVLAERDTFVTNLRAIFGI